MRAVTRVMVNMWVRRTYRGRPITTVSVKRFRCASRSALRCYPRSFFFWWPILEARAERHNRSAADLLLNPIFRWAFLGQANKLEAIENELTQLDAALGFDKLQALRDQLLQDLGGHALENDAHNRLLSSRAETRAILNFTAQGMTVCPIPRQSGRRTPDLRAIGKLGTVLIEAKYCRQPDKLGEYLFRWWQAQKDVAGEIPWGISLQQRFRWKPVECRKELSAEEISVLRDFWITVFLHPERQASARSGRLCVGYLPAGRLPIAAIPLLEQAAQSEQDRQRIFENIRTMIANAAEQLAPNPNQHQSTLFLLLNLSQDVRFLWRERFEERLEELKQDVAREKGIDVVVDLVDYL